MRENARLLLLSAVAAVAVLAPASPASAVTTIDIPYTEVVGKYNDGGNCAYYHYFLQITEVPGATSYSALNRYHGGGFTLNYSGPPFPDDLEEGEGFSFAAPAGTHRWGATAGSGPGPCTDSVKDEWEPDYVRAHFEDFKVSGEVKDGDGEPVVGATVNISGPESDSVTTDGNGAYSSSDFTTQGTYTVQMASRFCVVGTDPCERQKTLELPPNGEVDFVDAGGEPLIDSITFREPSIRTGELVDVGAAGTTDGNRVEITARVRSPLTFAQEATLEFRDPVTGVTLPGGQRQLTLPANGTVEEKITIDATGYAWLGGGAARTHVNVRADLTAGSSFSSKSVRLGVRPKPLVLVHGLNATFSTFQAYSGIGFPAGAHPGWRGYAVGDGQAPGTMNTSPFSNGMLPTRGNAAQVDAYVDGVREATNAAHVDLLAHSLGGLISRRYIHDFMPKAADGKPVASHLVMMGTPNHGSPCGDVLSASFLSAGQTKVGIEELTQYAALDFNRDVTNRKGVRFSGLVGNRFADTCGVLDRGDEYVTVPSARWEMDDTSTLRMKHTDMTSSPAAFEFVKSRLALDRGAAGMSRAPSPLAMQSGTAMAHAAASRPRRCAARSRKTVQLHASFIRTVKARGTAKFAIPVSQAKRVSVTVALPLSVKAVLRDPSGKVRATSAATAGTKDGSVRTLTVSKPRVGKWRLELIQTAGRRAPVAVAAMLAGSRERLLASAKRGKRRTLLVTTTALKGKRRVRGLRISGRLGLSGRKKARKLTLRDTGRRGDRKARDGTYTARVRPVPPKGRIAISSKGKGFALTTETGWCGS